ncbi:MAG TPA: hypothetical protein VFG83_07940 [Kofleriaceae bacterium]|nr:hypothetical protein [Kofleriaceae bacterium]
MKTIAVVIRARAPGRVGEALRAAVGLGLRGDRVEVVLETPASGDPFVARALATLAVLGQPVHQGRDPAAIDRLLRTADAVEIWTG